MPELGYPVFDADNHYYEAIDAFTRHLDPRTADRTVQWADLGGRKYHLVAGRLCRAVANPTFDPIARPGALHDYLRGNPDRVSPLAQLREREPIPAAYREPEARLRVMDEQGVAQTWLFPTLGVLYEELLKHDPEAVTWTFRAFNQWMLEDWGFAHRDRIFAAPYLSLCDVDWAVQELERVLEQGARVIVMRPAAVFTAAGPFTPSDPAFDAFWARVDEAGIPVVVHAGDSGYNNNGYARDGFSSSFEGGSGRPSVKAWNIERAAHDFLATLIFDRLFERFPNLRIASVENGSEFLPDLFRKLRSTYRRLPGYFKEDPVETFRRHVWINPFWEDDVREITELMGDERVIFGSDWPHIEGMPQPLDYLAELEGFSAESVKRIVSSNATALNAPRPR